MVNVKNHQFLNGNCEFLSIIGVKSKHSVCFMTLFLVLVLFTACIYIQFFVLEIFKFKYDKLFASLPFPNLNDLNNRALFLLAILDATSSL